MFQSLGVDQIPIADFELMRTDLKIQKRIQTINNKQKGLHFNFELMQTDLKIKWNSKINKKKKKVFDFRAPLFAWT